MPSDLQFHPAAGIFPLMDGDALEALAEDIREHGLQAPIELLDGKVIDGRNRYKACLLAGIEPDYVEAVPDGSPVDYVLSMNLHRRHLNETQRAQVGDRLKDFYAAEAKERQKDHGGTAPGKAKNTSGKFAGSVGGDARDKAGAAVGVSGKSIDHATKVRKEGCAELQAAVDRREIAISQAAKLADLPKAEQNKALADGKQGVRDAISPPAPKPTYPLSIGFTKILADIVGALTLVRKDHKKASAMFKDKRWDPSATEGVVQMIRSLRQTFAEMEKEIRSE